MFANFDRGLDLRDVRHCPPDWSSPTTICGMPALSSGSISVPIRERELDRAHRAIAKIERRLITRRGRFYKPKGMLWSNPPPVRSLRPSRCGVEAVLLRTVARLRFR